MGCGMWDVRNLKGGVQDENRKARLGYAPFQRRDSG